MFGISWVGIAASNAVTKSVVHFLPSAGNVSAPYPTNCKLTIFGQSVGRKSVTLDGARLNQPDGVRLDQAFPALQEGVSSFFGLAVEITSQQQRVDLGTSSVIVELLSAAQSIRYSPHVFIDDEPYRPKSSVALRDAFSTTSLVIVNGGPEVHRPPVNPGFTVEGVGSDCVMEIELGEKFLQSVEPLECNWGLCRAHSVEVRAEIPSQVGYFLVYRDVTTKRPVNIVAL